MSFESKSKQTAMLTVDVEDNFTREELAHPGDWDKYESQVVDNTNLVINLLKSINAGATFFILGKVAERHPEIVAAIHEAGHEVASHGYAHEIVWKMSKTEFEKDIEKSVASLKSVIKKGIKGFRARSFSITKQTPWALKILRKHGFMYDSSMKDIELFNDDNGQLIEVPISTAKVLGTNMNLSGGIALRLLPFLVYRTILHNSSSFHQHPVFYFHVWEFNKDQPKRKIGIMQSLSQAPFTFTTPQKIRALSEHYSFVSVESYLGMNQTESCA